MTKLRKNAFFSLQKLNFYFLPPTPSCAQKLKAPTSGCCWCKEYIPNIWLRSHNLKTKKKCVCSFWTNKLACIWNNTMSIWRIWSITMSTWSISMCIWSIIMSIWSITMSIWSNTMSIWSITMSMWSITMMLSNFTMSIWSMTMSSCKALASSPSLWFLQKLRIKFSIHCSIGLSTLHSKF